ncbi:hypothetical protein CTE07_32280 [Chitinophaga terrae (ex Kim and Jung 2007)]|nr:hypothetical protein CTE07_32280 [Chitinophaga terrae (ex Kim and Jung 2007)]
MLTKTKTNFYLYISSINKSDHLIGLIPGVITLIKVILIKVTRVKITQIEVTRLRLPELRLP